MFVQLSRLKTLRVAYGIVQDNAYARLDCKREFGSVPVDTPLSDAAGERIYQLTDPTQDITVAVTSRQD